MKTIESCRCPSAPAVATAMEPLEQRVLLYGTTVGVNLNVTHQTMEGFGAALESWTRRPEYSDPAFYDRIVNDLGATAARAAVWPSFEKTNDDSDPDTFNWAGYDPQALGLTMTFLKRLQDRGMDQFLATVWTPPAWMKTNQSHHFGGTVRPDLREEFAEYLAAVMISAQRDWGVDISHVSPQNEPFFVQEYESGVTTDVQMRELVRATMRKFEAEGLDTRLIAPEEMAKQGRYDWYVNAIMNDPETRNFPGSWGVHSATNPHWPQVNAAVEGTGHSLWMTESHGHGQTITGALGMAQDIYNALTQANASAYLYWQWSEDAGGSHHSLMIDGQPAIKYHVAKHFYRYVRPGAVRIGATSGDARLRSISFKHPQTGAVTHVLFNPNDSNATASMSLSGSDLPASYKHYRTSATENHVQLGNIAGGSQVSVTLPPNSIVTLYSGPDLQPVHATSGGSLPNKVDYSDAAITNPIRIAAAWGDAARVRELLAAGADPNDDAFSSYAPLHAAAMSPYAGAVETINALLDGGASVNWKTGEGFTPLHIAAMNVWTRGSTQTTTLAGDKVRALIARGASVSATDDAGRTPLHWAAMMPKLNHITNMTTDPVVVDALLDGGSAVNALDDQGFTPLDYALREGNSAAYQELQEAGGVHGAGGPSGDVTSPTADVADVSPDPRATAVDTVDVVFSEPVTGVDIGDFIFMRDGVTHSLSGATVTRIDATTWRVGNLATLTAAAGGYMLKLEKAGSGIIDAAGNPLATSASDSWTMQAPTSNPQRPYTGVPVAVGSSAVTIQAEDFDLGGEGVAYHDTSVTNTGGQYRPGEAVDIMSHAAGQYRIGGPYAGEWMEYTIDVATAGDYELEFRVSQTAAGATFHGEINGVNVTGALVAPSTGNFNTFASVKKTVTMAAGVHVLRFAQDGNASNGYAAGLDWMKLTRAVAEPPPPAQQPFHGTPFAVGSSAVTIQAEDFDLGGEGIAYHDTSVTNTGGQHRPGEAVDIMSHAAGQFRIGGPYSGEWMEYSINVATAGNYELEFRVSQTAAGATFHGEIDGVNVTGALAVPSTGSFDTFTSVKKTVALTAGQHVLRFTQDGAAGNGYAAGLDWIKVAPAATAPPPGADSMSTVVSTDVAYVRDGAFAGVNYGADEQMLVKRSDTVGYTREGYIKFDLTGVGSITGAKLRLFGRLSEAAPGGLALNVHSAADSAWAETGITWDNQPAVNAVARGTLTVTGTADQWYEVDLTGFLQSELAAGRKVVTLVLRAPEASSYWAIFAADNTPNGPRLVLTT